MLSNTLLRLPQVIKATGRSRASIFRDMREGKLPRSVRSGTEPLPGAQVIFRNGSRHAPRPASNSNEPREQQWERIGPKTGESQSEDRPFPIPLG